MKVSVVLAVYNGEKYLKEQLKSLMNQTYLIDEVLIGDDCSNDSTVIIVKEFINKNNLNNIWKIFENCLNKGYSKNFMDIINKATGDVVFFCDQDDIWMDDKIESMVNIMEANSDIQLLASNLIPFYCDQEAVKWDKKILNSMKEDKTIEKVIYNYKNFHVKRSGCTMCVNNHFIKQVSRYWVNGWAHDDFIWKMSSCIDGCAIYHYPTINRRMHANNATNIKIRSLKWRIEEVECMLEQCKSLLQYAKSHNLKNKKEKIKIMKDNLENMKIRNKMFESKNFFLWFKLLIMYQKCYPRIKGLYLDLYLMIFGVYKTRK